MSNSIDYRKVLKAAILDFFDDVEAIFTDEDSLADIWYVKAFIRAAPEEDIMEIFHERIDPYEEKILEKDEDFFIADCETIFRLIPVEKIKFFQQAVIEGVLSENDKDMIWEHLILMLKISLRDKKLP